MNSSETLRKEVKRLRIAYQENPGRYVKPPSIEYLEDLLKTTGACEDDYDVFDLYGSLCMEYIKYKMYANALEILETRAKRYKDNPISWISLAEHLNFFEKNYSEAKRISLIAIQVAKQNGKFLRYAYNNLARAARNLGDYELLESSISEIIKIRTLPGRGDIDYEEDFITDLPDGVIDKELLAEYWALIHKTHSAE